MPSCPLDSHVDKSYQRNSMASRDTMMRNLLKITDNGRDQGTKEHYIDRRKLTLIDELTHAPQMPLMLRDYPSTRKAKPAMAGAVPRSRSSSVMSGRTASSAGVRLTPIKPRAASSMQGSQTFPAAAHGGPTKIAGTLRPEAFYKSLSSVDPRFLAKVHKNMQEKVYVRFKNAREAFRRFDLDHSGAIDFWEFKTVLKDLELIGKESESQIEALFHVCDESGKGQISYLDFCKWIKASLDPHTANLTRSSRSPNFSNPNRTPQAPDLHENLMARRETPYHGQRGGMSYHQRANWIRAKGVMCE